MDELGAATIAARCRSKKRKNALFGTETAYAKKAIWAQKVQGYMPKLRHVRQNRHL